MKITKLEILRPGWFILIKLHTDEGIVGIGDCHPGSACVGSAQAVIGALKFCEEQLIGQDPLTIEAHWQNIFRRTLFRGGSDPMSALGAVDMALWDIAGKAYGLPVYKLLGGLTRSRIRLYVQIGGKTPEEVAESAQRAVAQGFTGVKLVPLDRSFERKGYWSNVRVAVRYVEAVRKAVGDDIDIGIDVICRLKPFEAIAIGRALEPYGLYYFEDPIEPDNIDAMAYVAANVPVPIATGERLYTIFQFRELLNKNAAQFVRPDASLVGGISNCKKIAALAEASYVGVMLHNPLTPVLTAVNVQLSAAIHNCVVLEYMGIESQGALRDLVKEPVPFDNGYLIVPDKPGLGVELDEEGIRKHPQVPGSRSALISSDGSLRDY